MWALLIYIEELWFYQHRRILVLPTWIPYLPEKGPKQTGISYLKLKDMMSCIRTVEQQKSIILYNMKYKWRSLRRHLGPEGVKAITELLVLNIWNGHHLLQYCIERFHVGYSICYDFTYSAVLNKSSFVSILCAQIICQASAHWRAFSFAATRSSRQHWSSRSGHLTSAKEVLTFQKFRAGTACTVRRIPFTGSAVIAAWDAHPTTGEVACSTVLYTVHPQEMGAWLAGAAGVVR